MAIKNVLIYGGGLMGKNIGFNCTVLPDVKVTIFDIFPVDVHAGIKDSTKQLVEKGIISEEELAERLSRISFTQDLESEEIKNADMVIEAIFEKLDAKREVFGKLEERCRPDCIFCTNTSVISPTEISSELKHRERFCGTHFWNPGHLIPLVEIVRTDTSSDEVINTVYEFMKGIGKKPCICNKDVPGFIGNRLQYALYREAIYIIENDIADAETVDIAIKNSFGLRLPQLAPMENMDLIGNDLVWNISDYILQHLADNHEPSPLLTKMRDENKLGFKTGEGWMKWDDESIKKCREDLNTYLIKMLYDK